MKSSGNPPTRLARVIRAITLSLALTATLLTATTSTAGAQNIDDGQLFLDTHPTACPQLTDSIFRLYTAYFQRNPDEGGWAFWNERYANESATLDVMSDFFASSPEFIERYGTLNNEQFVNLVYQNVLGRLPDPGGFDFWVNSLNNGYLRGALMISFSESEEYVLQTGTVPPAAGWLRWYQVRVQYDCAFGNLSSRAPAAGPTAHADVQIFNPTDFPQFVNVYSTQAGSADFLQTSVTIPAQGYYIFWNVVMGTEDGFRIDLPESFFWSVTYFDNPHDDIRPPWTDGADVARTAARTTEGWSNFVANGHAGDTRAVTLS